MRQVAAIIAIALPLIMSGCAASSDDPASTVTVAPESVDAATPEAVAPPSAENNAAFRGVPPPTHAIYTNESENAGKPCRDYTSAETPYTIVSDHVIDLEAVGWTVSNLVRTGYDHSSKANFTATADGRTLAAFGEGAGPNSSRYVVCIDNP